MHVHGYYGLVLSGKSVIKSGFYDTVVVFTSNILVNINPTFEELWIPDFPDLSSPKPHFHPILISSAIRVHLPPLTFRTFIYAYILALYTLSLNTILYLSP